LNLELFIANRLSGNNSNAKKKVGTGRILSFAKAGIAIGIAVMLISVAIITGFQNEIRDKVVGFGAHLHISEFNYDDAGTLKPISQRVPFYKTLDSLPGIRNVQSFAVKEGIIKTGEAIEGVLTKGIASDYDWSFFEKHMIKGSRLPLDSAKKSNGVLISKTISQRLKLDLGSSMIVYYIQDGKSRPRKFIVEGIYETGLAQFDEKFILIDIRHLQRLYGWEEHQVGGFEVILKDYKELDKLGQYIYNHIPHDYDTRTIEQEQPEIFGWLDLLDMNVVIILTLMWFVSAINMTTALLILILERVNMIGLLKAMGAKNWSIRKIFLYQAGHLILKGMLWGNIIGLGIGFIQKQFKIITLPQESYYLDAVPINIELWHVLSLNGATFVLCMITLILPSYVVSKIKPVKAIKFN